jgi:hypothetical protein
VDEKERMKLFGGDCTTTAKNCITTQSTCTDPTIPAICDKNLNQGNCWKCLSKGPYSLCTSIDDVNKTCGVVYDNVHPLLCGTILTGAQVNGACPQNACTQSSGNCGQQIPNQSCGVNCPPP